jgi:hypothetical protein
MVFVGWDGPIPFSERKIWRRQACHAGRRSNISVSKKKVPVWIHSGSGSGVSHRKNVGQKDAILTIDYSLCLG